MYVSQPQGLGGLRSCVQEHSEKTPASIKRHPAQIRYNSPPWIWQLQQFRRRLTPRRRIQSSGASPSSVRTAIGGATSAGIAMVPASVSMARGAACAGNAMVPATASTTSNAICARRAMAPAYASTASSAPYVRRVVAPASAPTANCVSAARIAKTYRAPWKAAHDSVTASALSSRC